ncbi:signal peptidase I [Cellulosimicrobium cellulans]|uniref:signal peptidase I n=1 Tax=Cellulosimicrobium cellulans TaxID=1710 RepID=UPI001964DE0D|nr:signal peptidase I [Cellulosimicrobium cellulans]MBN0042440.1 signal peptidase I [Cellulosimicrobium cellulans]
MPERRHARDGARRHGPLARALGALALACAVVLALVGVVVPLVLGATPYTVLTGSMRPTYPPGTMVVVRPVAVERVVPGDVVTYQLASGRPEVVTHRVVAVGVGAGDERVLTTRGDANAAPDPEPVRPVQVRGTVVYAVPLLGWVSSAVSGDTRRTVAVVAAAGLLAWGAWQVVAGLRERGRRGRSPSAVAT